MVTRKIPSHKIAISDWKMQHAEIIEFIRKLGFTDLNPHDQFDDLVFFEKRIVLDYDLGADIVDEVLKVPQVPNVDQKLLDKYGLTLADYSPFYEKSIIRKRQICLSVLLRLRIQSSMNDSPLCHIGLVCQNHFTDLDMEKRIDSFDNVELVKAILTEIETKIAGKVKILTDSIPERIELDRKQIIQWKSDLQKAIRNAKARQFLYGALQQFDALQ